MTLEDSIHSQRLRVLRDAERLGNVTEACRRHGMSRTLFYRLRQRFEQYGPDGVHPKRRQARRGRPAAIAVQTERRVIAFALAWPTCGPQWYSDQLARDGVVIAPTTIWRLLRRQRLGTRKARLAVLEQCSAATTGVLTERTVKPLRHVEAAQPGDLLSLDTFYGDITAYCGNDHEAFLGDRMRHDATLRKLEVIGQAAKNLSEQTKSREPEILWKQIAGMRDKVSHDYFGVNLEIVWAVAQKELPKLTILRTPIRAPQANSFCERLVGTIRRECSDPPTDRVVGQSGGHRLPKGTRVVATPILDALHHEYRLEPNAA